jgi:hypothetical protein
MVMMAGGVSDDGAPPATMMTSTGDPKISALGGNHSGQSALCAARLLFCPHMGLCLGPATGGFFFGLPISAGARAGLRQGQTVSCGVQADRRTD